MTSTFKEIIQELFCEKTRAILTIIAIACGTFAIAFMLAVGEGLRLNFGQVTSSYGSKLLVIKPGMTSKSYKGIQANKRFKFTKRDIETIATLPNIDDVSIQYDIFTTIRHKNNEIKYEPIRAVSSRHAAIHNIEVASGQRFFSEADVKDRRPVIVIGSAMANKLFTSKPYPIGDAIYIGNYPFILIGVAQEKPQMNSLDIPNAWLGWIPSSTYEMLANPKKIDVISISYKDFDKLPQTKANIQKVLALAHGVDPNDSNIINFSDIAEDQKKVNDFFINMQIFLGVIGGLTLLLAGIGIANVMFAAVKRSTKEIGIRMALGATTKNILSRYILESLIATAIGGMIGIAVAIIFTYLAQLIPVKNPIVLEIIGKPKPVLSLMVFIIVIGVLGLVGFISGFFPALKATKIDPAEALIYE